MSSPPAYKRFFAELKRRRVFRVMTVYGVVGFVILEVVDLAVPALLLPDWTYRLVALILLIGFPVAIVLAWAFELTPEGVQRARSATNEEIEATVAAPASARWPIGLAALALLTTTLVACAPAQFDTGPTPAAADAGDAPVWSVDLVRTLPGAQLDYVRSIETNWAGARAIAREHGAVLSFRALVAAPDTARGWDVLLMTEYADSAAYANREETFQAIFTSPEFVAVEPARPSAELREFMSGDVVLRQFVSSGGR